MEATIEQYAKGSYLLEVRTLPYFKRYIAALMGMFSNAWMTEYAKKHGTLKWSDSIDNLITSVGKAALAGLTLNSGAVTAFSYLELGSNATAVAIGQTALQAAISTSGLARAAATASRVNTVVTNDTAQLAYTWTASGAQTVEEIGVFNASSAGVMLSRILTGTKTISNGDLFTATYKLQFV